MVVNMSDIAKFPMWQVNIEKQTVERKEGAVATERRLRIIANDTQVANLAMSPSMEKEAVIGFLLSEGYVKSLDEIKKLELKGDEMIVSIKTEKFEIQREIIQTTECTGGWRARLLLENPKITATSKFSSAIITKILKEFQDMSKVWRSTGGVHSAAIATFEGAIVAFTEDISRYVAVDKVIGQAALSGIDFTNTIVISSGRQPADIVLKVARVGIPVIISRTAPLDSGVEAAQKTGLTLIGFARGTKMNIYTHPERINQLSG